MTAPLLPRLLLAAVTPPADHDSVAGDLQEEYAHRRASLGRSRADRWFCRKRCARFPRCSRTPGTLPRFESAPAPLQSSWVC